MKKLYSFVAVMVMSVLGFMGFAQDAQKGVYFVKGDFYYFAAQSDANPRAEAFAIVQGSYDGNYSTFEFNTNDNPFNLKGQNEKNSFYVYLNNEAVENSETGVLANMFDAQVNLAAGDVVKVYSEKPFVTNMEIGFMQPTSEVQDQVTIIVDGINSFENAYDTKVKVLEGTTFKISATEGNVIANVYCNNEDVEAVDGVYTVTANVEGDMLVIIDMAESTQAQAQALISGEFYTFVAQSDANNRIEPLNVEFGEYNCEYRTLNFNTNDNPFVLKGYNPSNTFYVYLNDETVANTEVGELANGFQAPVTLAEGDVLKVYDHQPFVTNIKVDYADGEETAAAVVILADGVNAVTGNEIKALEGTRYEISAVTGARISKVLVDGVAVEAENGVYTIVADVEGDVTLTIDIASVEEGMFYVDGTFYTFTAQSVDNNRIEPISVVRGEYDGEYRGFAFDPSQNPFAVKGVTESGEIYVYLNNEVVENSEAGVMANMFDAEVNLAAGDVLKAYDHKPYVTNFGIGFMQTPTEVYNKVVVTMDGITPVKGLEADNAVYHVLEGTKFEVRPVDGAQIANVYLNNEDVYPVDGVYTVYASQEGDMLLIIDMVETCEAVAYIQGQFYTFVAQAEANNRIEPLDVQAGTYQEYRTMSFSTANNPFNLKGQNEGNNFYVYLNGFEVANTPQGEMSEMFFAPVNLEANDVLKVYSKKPFVSFVAFNFAQPREKVYNKVDVVMDQILPVTTLDYEVGSVITCLEGTEFQITAVENEKINKVTVDGEEITPVDGVYYVYANHEEDITVVIDVDGYDSLKGIGVAEKLNDNNVYNMQGMLLIENAEAQQISNLAPGMYIINGAKVVVR